VWGAPLHQQGRLRLWGGGNSTGNGPYTIRPYTIQKFLVFINMITKTRVARTFMGSDGFERLIKRERLITTFELFLNILC
jgi:hypothetical protein